MFDWFLIDFSSNQAFHQQTRQQTNLSTNQPFNKQPFPGLRWQRRDAWSVYFANFDNPLQVPRKSKKNTKSD